MSLPSRIVTINHKSVPGGKDETLKMHVMETRNAQSATNQVLVCFVHGFPELAYSWRHQMKAMDDAGIRAIAPDMRGYGKTDAPHEVEKYSFEYICKDLIALIKSYSANKAIFVGHDFGGSVVWSMATHHPDNCLGIISLNTSLVNLSPEIKQLIKSNGCKGFIEYLGTVNSEAASHLDYVVYYQKQGIAEKELEKDIEKTINAFFRSQISGDRAKDKENMKIGMRTNKVRKNGGVLTLCPEKIPRDPIWSQEEVDTYVEAFTKKGFRGPLNWYRNMDNNDRWDESCGIDSNSKLHPDIRCLMVTAEYDVVLSPEKSKSMENRIKHLDRAHLKCGHWTQHEKSKEVNEILTKWLQTNMGYFKSKL